MTYRKIINTLFLILLLASSCSQRVELEKIAELQSQLNTCDSLLLLDIKLFEDRKSQIELDLQAMKRFEVPIDESLALSLDKYKVVKKIYAKQVKQHSKLMNLKSDLQKQLDDLEKDISNLKLSKDEFKAYYRTEKNDIEQLLRDATAVRKALYELEPEYRRLDKLVQQELSPYLD